MKAYLLLIIGLLFYTASNAQIVNIPDANFKNALVNDNVADLGSGFYEDADTNNDGEIQVTEAEAVETLIVNFYDIASMEGIESFINLIGLECTDNLLTNLDITLNTNLSLLHCDYNDITELDVSQNVSLSILSCSRNELNSLDVTQNLNMLNLNCSHNNLAEIDVSQNLNLSTLGCNFNNLSELDVTLNANLASLSCSVNNLTSIDVSQNNDLIFFTCGANEIEQLDLSQNPNLIWIQCQSNEPLNYLDIRNGNNPQLTIMWAHDTPNLNCILVDDETYANEQACGLPTSGWCKDETDQYIEDIEDCVLGIGDSTYMSFILYPNPVKEVLNIVNQERIEAIQIYSSQGILVIETSTSDEIDVSDLKTGMYFVQLSSEGKTMIRKFIKE